MLQEVSKAIERGDTSLITGLVCDALDAGDPPLAIFNEDMLPAICCVFEKYGRKAVSRAALQLSVKALRLGMAPLKPYLTKNCITDYGADVITAFVRQHDRLADELANVINGCLGFKAVFVSKTVSCAAPDGGIAAHCPPREALSYLPVSTHRGHSAGKPQKVFINKSQMRRIIREKSTCNDPCAAHGLLAFRLRRPEHHDAPGR